MIAQSTFNEYLSAPPALQPLSFSYIGRQGEHIKQWVINLSMQGEIEQCAQLEKTLSELILIQMGDNTRLDIMMSLIPAIERLSAQLHNHYVYETGPLKPEQLGYAEKVKSLYYMSILVYNGIIKRQQALAPTPTNTTSARWRRLLPITKAQGNSLGLAIYWAMNNYQKLLFEFALAYQKSPSFIWRHLNQLYVLAVNHNLTGLDLSRHLATKHADSIHQRYCQICLQSLLNLSTYRRQDIIGLKRMLPKWSQYISATLLPVTKTRVFVDLTSDHSPQYLTPNTSINPYDDKNTCLFIEVLPLLEYLEKRKKQSVGEQADDILEHRLIDKTLTTLQHQYYYQQRRLTPRETINKKATLITGFNHIYYHIAGKRSLASLIHQKELLEIYHPKFTADTKQKATDAMIEVELLDQSVAGYRFQLTASVEESTSTNPAHSNNAAKLSPAANANATKDLVQHNSDAKGSLDFAPPVLQVLKLFAMRDDNQEEATQWQIGIVRWIETIEDRLQAGGRLLGYSVTACGIRLENNDGRTQDFVAALLIAGNDKLKTKPSLLIPRYHFRQGDRVVLRLQDKQTVLCLQQQILATDDIEQFEIIKLAS